MYDLKKIDERFHEFFGPRMEKYLGDIEITGELFERAEMTYIPFGHMRYGLIIEDERPVLKVRMISRMDTNTLYFISEDDVEAYNLFDKSREEVREILKNRKKSQIREVS